MPLCQTSILTQLQFLQGNKPQASFNLIATEGHLMCYWTHSSPIMSVNYTLLFSIKNLLQLWKYCALHQKSKLLPQKEEVTFLCEFVG